MPTSKQLQEKIGKLKKKTAFKIQLELGSTGLSGTELEPYKTEEGLDKLVDILIQYPEIKSMKDLGGKIKELDRKASDEKRKKKYVEKKKKAKEEEKRRKEIEEKKAREREIEMKKRAKIEVKITKELKNDYSGLYSSLKGMEKSALDVEVAQRIAKEAKAWLEEWKTVTLPEYQKELKEIGQLLKEAYDKMPEIIKKAKAFEAAHGKASFDLKSLTAKELVAGLLYFNPDLKKEKGEEYLKTLKEKGKEITTFAEAAALLFSDSKGVKKRVDDFKLAQKIVTDYPSDVIGIYYRGDKRVVKDLTAKGFTAFDELTIEKARKKVIQWFGSTDTTSPATYHEEHIRNNLSDLISFGNDIGCMGYGCIGVEGANRNVYQVKVKGLKKVTPSKESLGEEPHAKQGPVLLMNKDKVSEATIIAVKGVVAAETTFFTSIPSGIGLIYEAPDKNAGIKGGWVKEVKVF